MFEKWKILLKRRIGSVTQDNSQPKFTLERRSGNTTRLVDEFVQDFFTKGECQVWDHYNTYESRKRVLHILLRRLSREHRIERKDVSIDMNTFIVKRNIKR